MNIAFVLLTYGPDEPAGVERSLAALVHGLHQLGHTAYVLAAGEPTQADGPEIVRLPSVTLPRPAVEADLLTAISAAPRLVQQVTTILTELHVDLVCWGDVTWGLGYLAPAPPGMRTALKVPVLRTDWFMYQALRHRPDRVLTSSEFVRREAAEHGLDAGRWLAVPNGLLFAGTAPAATRRERCRTDGPVRVVARAEPHKGVAELITACPADFNRPVEIVLASAGFEYWRGMQDDVLAACRSLADRAPAVSLLGPLPWHEVQPFLAEASCTMISSTSPETFCQVALEAMSVGTPVVSFDLGNVPELVGDAGWTVPLEAGAPALWAAAEAMLADPGRYGATSSSATSRAAAYSPRATAQAFLAAVGLGPDARSQPGAKVGGMQCSA